MIFIIRDKEIRKRCADAVMQITKEPLMEVVIRPYKKTRTKKQNAGYWPMLKDLAKKHGEGNSDEDYHAIFKKMFLGRESIVIDGIHADKFVSTTDLTTEEFIEYVENIVMFASIKWQVKLHPYEQYVIDNTQDIT